MSNWKKEAAVQLGFPYKLLPCISSSSQTSRKSKDPTPKLISLTLKSGKRGSQDTLLGLQSQPATGPSALRPSRLHGRGTHSAKSTGLSLQAPGNNRTPARRSQNQCSGLEGTSVGHRVQPPAEAGSPTACSGWNEPGEPTAAAPARRQDYRWAVTGNARQGLERSGDIPPAPRLSRPLPSGPAKQPGATGGKATRAPGRSASRSHWAVPRAARGPGGPPDPAPEMSSALRDGTGWQPLPPRQPRPGPHLCA